MAPSINKTHLPIVSLNVRELELMLKGSVKKKWRSLFVGVKAQLPSKFLKIR